MDLRIFIGGLIIALLSTVSPGSAGAAYSCRTCKPGYYASRLCSRHHDTVCKPCPAHTFSAASNTYTSCFPCSRCAVHEFVVEECTLNSDTTCAPCDSIKDSFSPHFRIECLQQDEPPQLKINETDGIILKRNEQDSLYESSGEVDGSGAETNETVDAGKYPVVNGTEDEGEEDKEEAESGSGDDLVTAGTDPGVNTTGTTTLTQPDEKEEPTAGPNMTQTTTVRTGIISIGDDDDGVVLANATVARGQADEVLVATADEGTVYIHDTGDNEDNQPKTGASQKEDTGADRAGASVGVVVTVGLVTAFVFFVLGFLASRVWNGRRERTFNVMEAERRNGKPGVECSGIEYKDPENKLTKAAGVYDEIPANSKVNGSGVDPKPNNSSTAPLPPIYTKPLKKSTASSSKVPPPKAPRNSTTDSQQERPVSEIRFIDEDPDDVGETDTLLPSAPPPTVSSPTPVKTSSPPTVSNPTPALSDDAPGAPAPANSDKAEQDASNEQTPMLPKDNESGLS